MTPPGLHCKWRLSQLCIYLAFMCALKPGYLCSAPWWCVGHNRTYKHIVMPFLTDSHCLCRVLALDTSIFIKEECLSNLHWFAHAFTRLITKLGLPLHSTEIFCKKRETPFNFVSPRTLKYSLCSTFHFQTLCRRQDSWHLCILLLFRMLFIPQMCSARHPSVPSAHSDWCVPSFGHVQNGSMVRARVQT